MSRRLLYIDYELPVWNVIKLDTVVIRISAQHLLSATHDDYSAHIAQYLKNKWQWGNGI